MKNENKKYNSDRKKSIGTLIALFVSAYLLGRVLGENNIDEKSFKDNDEGSTPSYDAIIESETEINNHNSITLMDNKTVKVLKIEPQNEWVNKTKKEFFNYELGKVDFLGNYINFDNKTSILNQIYNYCKRTDSTLTEKVEK